MTGNPNPIREYLSIKLFRCRRWFFSNPRATLYSGIFACVVMLCVIGAVSLHKPSAAMQALNEINNTTSATANPLDPAQAGNVSAEAPVALALNDSNSVAAANGLQQDSVSPAQQKFTTVRAKDNLNKIFKRVGLNPKDANKILVLNKSIKSLRTMPRGQKIAFAITADKKLQQLEYQTDLTTTVTIAQSNNYRAKITHLTPTTKLEYLATTIKGSPLASARSANVPREVLPQLATILNSNKNPLAGKTHAGDKLALLYREEFINDKKIKTDDIAALELTHNDAAYRVIGFTDPKGFTNYYTADGYSLKAPFVRFPVSKVRVTSPFTLSRWHPLLHVYRAHTGTDFGGAYGTPIKATSDGVVEFFGNHFDYGRTVIIAHNEYSTLYGHLSRYAEGLTRGKMVHQGEVIAYMGNSGLTTGTHVHYEFRINGRFYDPMKVKLPPNEMIAKAYRHQFFAQTKVLLAQLELHKQPVLAAATDSALNGDAKS